MISAQIVGTVSIVVLCIFVPVRLLQWWSDHV